MKVLNDTGSQERLIDSYIRSRTLSASTDRSILDGSSLEQTATRSPQALLAGGPDDVGRTAGRRPHGVPSHWRYHQAASLADHSQAMVALVEPLAGMEVVVDAFPRSHTQPIHQHGRAGGARN